MRLILPKTLVEAKDYAGLPLFFLAGPILGAGDWQASFCQILSQAMRGKDFAIAVPCRWKEDHPLHKYQVPGIENAFHRQRAWERHYMTLTSRSGGIIFWFATESRTEPRADGNPYGMDTRREMSEWAVRYFASFAYANAPEVRLFIGAENQGRGFPGFDTMRYDLMESDMLGDGFRINGTMGALADEVAEENR